MHTPRILSWCGHCGLYHLGTCPRVGRIDYYPDGTVKTVEYLPANAPAVPCPGDYEKSWEMLPTGTGRKPLVAFVGASIGNTLRDLIERAGLDEGDCAFLAFEHYEASTEAFAGLRGRLADVGPPLVICCLGSLAVKALLGYCAGQLGKLRGVWHEYQGIPTLVTYHPGYLAWDRKPKKEADVLADFLLIAERVESLTR